MRKYLFILSVFFLVISSPAASFANHLYNPGLSVDCNAFTLTVTSETINYLSYEVAYELTLTPQNSAEAPIIVKGTFAVPGNVSYSVSNETFSGAWGAPLCGEFLVTGNISLIGIGYIGIGNDRYTLYTMDLTPASLVCGECTSDFAPRTQGYWKNHKNNWPVTELTIGGVLYSQAKLLGILKTPEKKDAYGNADMDLILKKQLIAAQLNVAAGAMNSASIKGVIAEANEYLAERVYDRDYAESLKNTLEQYNKSFE
jgi:hypothetical protein